MKNKKTKRRYLTRKKRMHRGLIRGALIVFAAYFFVSGAYQIGSAGYKAFMRFFFEWPEFAIAEVNAKKEQEIEVYEVASETIREVTAYNAGDLAQTDSSPCIGAYGDNICELLKQGKIIFASNAYPKGTKLQLIAPGTGWEMQGEIMDTMNSRFTNRIDIAMAKDEKARAVKFGKQNLIVRELK